MTRRIAVIGARLHGRPDQVRALVRSFAGQDVVIVSGGADGVDTWAEDAAREVDIPVDIHRPREHTRNELLARDARLAKDGLAELHAFPWWGARGTYYTMRLARDAGVPVVEHRREPLVEVWTTRLGAADPDILDITRKTATDRREALRGTEGARFLEAAGDPLRQLYELALDMEQHQGRSLLEIQRAKVLPTPLTLGEPWAPSNAILRPALEALASAQRIRDLGRPREADEAADRAWERYLHGDRATGTDGFLAEMKRSQRDKALAWGWAMARPLRGTPEAPLPSRLAIACFCGGDPAFCHRSVVAGMFGAMGAALRGEIPRAQLTLAVDPPPPARRPSR